MYNLYLTIKMIAICVYGLIWVIKKIVNNISNCPDVEKAYEDGNLEFVEANIGNDTYGNQRGLIKAITNGHLNIINFLLDSEVECNSLHLKQACDMNRPDIVKLLLEKIDHDDCLPTEIEEWIIRNDDNNELFKLLLTKIEYLSGRATRLLFQYNYIEFVKVALEYEKINLDSAFELACENGSVEIVKYLLENFGISDEEEYRGISDEDVYCGFISAIEHLQVNLVKYFVEKKGLKIKDGCYDDNDRNTKMILITTILSHPQSIMPSRRYSQ